jgi:hypothetical protein
MGLQVPTDIIGVVPSIYEEYVTTDGVSIADTIDKSVEYLCFNIGDRLQIMWWFNKDKQIPWRFLTTDQINALMTRKKIKGKARTTKKGKKRKKDEVK